MSKRRTFTPEFKAKVVLEVLSGTRSSSEACREYGLRASLLSRWKTAFVERSALVFESGEHRSQEQANKADVSAPRSADESETTVSQTLRVGDARSAFAPSAC